MTLGTATAEKLAMKRMRWSRRTVLAISLLAMVLPAGSLAAQSPDPATQAAATITAAALTGQLTGLAADSLQGRRTPSAALERTAQYVAAQFAAKGSPILPRPTTAICMSPSSPIDVLGT